MAANSVGELVAKFDRAATALPKAQAAAGRQAGAAIKVSWVAIAAANGLKPTSKIANRKWSVRYSLGKNGGLYVRFNGKIWLLNSDTKAAPIIPRGQRRAQGRALIAALTGQSASRYGGRGGKRALSFNGNARASANKKFQKGKNFWPACSKAAREIAPRVYRQNVGTNLLKTSGFGR
jgi:hypothetical protein